MSKRKHCYLFWFCGFLRGEKEHGEFFLLRKNRSSFCLPLPESQENSFPFALWISLGSQPAAHIPDLAYSCTLAWVMNTFQIDLFHCFPCHLSLQNTITSPIATRSFSYLSVFTSPVPNGLEFTPFTFMFPALPASVMSHMVVLNLN